MPNGLVLHHAQRTFTAPVNVHGSMWLEVSLADGRMRVMSVGSASSILVKEEVDEKPTFLGYLWDTYTYIYNYIYIHMINIYIICIYP